MDKLEKNCVSDKCWEEWTENKAVANAGVVVVNSRREVLLLCKEKGKDWGIPSGAINKGEYPIQAAIRELEEETKILITSKDLWELKTVTAHHDKGKTDVIVTFLSYPRDEECIRSDEHRWSQWIPLYTYNTTDLNIHPATREQLESAYNFIFKK
jgi:8-oxo-dGTP pyrophosphatase MutT (NUDIX family)